MTPTSSRQVIATPFSESTFAAASSALIFFSFTSAAGLVPFPFLVAFLVPAFFCLVLVAVMVITSVVDRRLPSSGDGCRPPRRSKSVSASPGKHPLGQSRRQEVHHRAGRGIGRRDF